MLVVQTQTSNDYSTSRRSGRQDHGASPPLGALSRIPCQGMLPRQKALSVRTALRTLANATSELRVNLIIHYFVSCLIHRIPMDK